MTRSGFSVIVNHLDDFLIIGNTHAECQQDLATLINLLYSLRVQYQVDKKVVSPSQWVPTTGFAGSWTACLGAEQHSLLHNQLLTNAGQAIGPSLPSNINYLELFPILIAARRLGPRGTDKRVCDASTDNTQVIAFINSGRAEIHSLYVLVA